MSLLAVILAMLAAGVVAWASQRIHANAPRYVSLVTFVVGLVWAAAEWLMGADMDGLYASQFIEWIPRFGINVTLSMDGLSTMLVALTMFLGIIAVVSSWDEIEERGGFFQFNILWVMAGVVGVQRSDHRACVEDQRQDDTGPSAPSPSLASCDVSLWPDRPVPRLRGFSFGSGSSPSDSFSSIASRTRHDTDTPRSAASVRSASSFSSSRVTVVRVMFP